MRPVLAVGIAALLLFSGCSTLTKPGPTADPGTDTGSESPTNQTASPTETPGPWDLPGTTVVAYENLSAREQAAFRSALGWRALFRPSEPGANGSWFHEAVLDAFRDVDYVRYRSRYYEPQISSNRGISRYYVEIEARTPPENATVVPLDSVNASVRGELRSAFESGERVAPEDGWDERPAVVEDLEYVRYENETYAVAVVVADDVEWELRVSRATR